MKRIAIIAFSVILLLLSGCSPPPKGQTTDENKPPASENRPPEQKRFVVTQEEGQTKNIGGFTIIKDTLTGKEYLVITGLNGATSVTPIE